MMLMTEEFHAKESTNIDWARYQNGCLFVDFKNSKGVRVSTYRYDGTLMKDGSNPTGCFPLEAWREFQAAASKGQHFAYKIRNIYRGEKL